MSLFGGFGGASNLSDVTGAIAKDREKKAEKTKVYQDYLESGLHTPAPLGQWTPATTGLMESMAALESGGWGTGTYDQVNDFYRAADRLFTQNPESWEEWAKNNDAFATRYHAMAAARGPEYSISGLSNEEHQALAYQHGYNLFGEQYGEDLKNDGKYYIYDWDYGRDVTPDIGSADSMSVKDFWRIGSMNTGKGGLGDLLDDNPWIVPTLGASALAAPAIATATGGGLLGGAAAGAVVSGGATAASGGDLGDVAEAAALGGVSGALLSPTSLGGIADALNVSPTVAGGLVTGGLTASQGGDLDDAAYSALGYMGIQTLGNYLGDRVEALSSGSSVPSTNQILDDVLPDAIAGPLGSFIDENITPWVDDMFARGDAGLASIQNALGDAKFELDLALSESDSIGYWKDGNYIEATPLLPQEVRNALRPLVDGSVDLANFVGQFGEDAARAAVSLILGEGARTGGSESSPTANVGDFSQYEVGRSDAFEGRDEETASVPQAPSGGLNQDEETANLGSTPIANGLMSSLDSPSSAAWLLGGKGEPEEHRGFMRPRKVRRALDHNVAAQLNQLMRKYQG